MAVREHALGQSPAVCARVKRARRPLSSLFLTSVAAAAAGAVRRIVGARGASERPVARVGVGLEVVDVLARRRIMSPCGPEKRRGRAARIENRECERESESERASIDFFIHSFLPTRPPARLSPRQPRCTRAYETHARTRCQHTPAHKLASLSPSLCLLLSLRLRHDRRRVCVRPARPQRGLRGPRRESARLQEDGDDHRGAGV